MTFDATLAVLLASRYCRNYPLFQWREEALPQIGKRTERYYFIVDLLNLCQEPCNELLFTMFPMEHSSLDFHNEDLPHTLKSLFVTIKHPYILPITDFHFAHEKKGLLIVQSFVSNGSLRDRIYQCDPLKSYENKYAINTGVPLPIEETRRFGRQILEGLLALRSKGILCCHINTGNIMIDNGDARISDIFNPLLGIDRDNNSRINTLPLEARVPLDVILFGQILYEMATGKQLLTSEPDENTLNSLDNDIEDVLRYIFYPMEYAMDGNDRDEAAGSLKESNEVEEDNSIDIEMLLNCPLFQKATVPAIKNLFRGFRFDSSMKSIIREVMRSNEARNEAHLSQYKDKVAYHRAHKRRELKVIEDQEKAKQKQLDFQQRKMSGNSSSSSSSQRWKSYRATSFTSSDKRLQKP